MNMKLKNLTGYISTPAEILMTLIIFLIAVLILQVAIIGMVGVLGPPEKWTEPRQPELTEARKQRWRINDMQKKFLPDGTIHLIETVKEEGKLRVVNVYDANETLLWSNRDKNPYHYLSWAEFLKGGINVDMMRLSQILTPEFSRTLVVPVTNDERQIVQMWRYEPGPDYFIGFDWKGRKIGYAGSNGFTEANDQAKPFGEFNRVDDWCYRDHHAPILLWQTTKRIYQIDFEKRDVKILLDLQDDEIKQVAWQNWQVETFEPDARLLTFIYVATKKGSHMLVFRDPIERLTIHVPRQWKVRSVQIAALEDKIFLKHYGSDWESPPRQYRLLKDWWERTESKSNRMWFELYEVEQDGNLKFISRFDWVRPPLAEKRTVVLDEPDDLRWKTRKFVTAVSAPLYLVSRFVDDVPSWSYEDVANNWNTWYDLTFEITRYFRATQIVLHCSAVVLMVCAAFWHAWPRRTTKAKLIFWLVLVALFNLAGFLTYLALNHTTVIRCSACGKKRGLDQNDCPACKALLPIPELRETDLILVGQSNS
jgi:hypothetical protein